MKAITIIFIITLFSILFYSCTEERIPECYDTIVFKSLENYGSFQFYLVKELNVAISCAKKHNKKVFVIFSADKYLSEKDPDWKTLMDKKILTLLNKNYVLVKLHTDDKTPLKDTTSINSHTRTYIRTVGERNSDLQIRLIGSNTVLIFAVLDTNMNVIKRGYWGYMKEGKKRLLEAMEDAVSE